MEVLTCSNDRIRDPLRKDLKPFFGEEGREGFSRQHSEPAYEYIQFTQPTTVASHFLLTKDGAQSNVNKNMSFADTARRQTRQHERSDDIYQRKHDEDLL